MSAIVDRIVERTSQLILDRLLSTPDSVEDLIAISRQTPPPRAAPKEKLDGPAKCPHCGRTFANLWGVEVHISRAHREKMYANKVNE